MGTDNIDLVFLLWGQLLTHRQFRLLLFMARTAKDGADERAYFGGHDKLAWAIGLEAPEQPMPDDDSPEANEARSRRHSVLEQVRRDLRCLEAVGAIKQTRKGSREHRMNAEYRLNLDPALALAGQRTKRVRSQRTEKVRSTHQNGAPNAPISGGLLQGLPPLQSETSSSSLLGTEPHQGAAKAADRGLDEQYADAKKILDRVGPEKTQAAMEAVLGLRPDIGPRERAILAAQRLSGEAA
jgi:hypothetical protein